MSDWLLFDHLGYLELLTTPVATQLLLGLGTGVIVFLILFINIRYAARSEIEWFYTIPDSLLGVPIELNKKSLKKIALIGAAIFALLYGFVARMLWYDVLAFINSTPFGQTDPIFDRDIAFYVFDLPIYTYFNSIFRSVVFISLISSGLVYLIKGELPKLERMSDITNSLRTIYNRGKNHLGLLILLLFATFAVDVYLDLHRLVLSPNGLIFGATHTDINVQIPMIWGSLFLVIAGILLTAIYLSTRKYFNWIVIIFVLYIFSGPIRAVSAGIAQGLVVAPNELEKERPYLENNIQATRTAYGLDDVEQQRLPADDSLDAQDIQNNQLTIKNVRLWDRQPLLSTFSQIQEIRTYYNFNLITNDRYMVDDELRQIMLSPRELDSDSLPNPSWINRHLVFTHGHGVVAGPVNRVTEEGLPVLFVKDLPSQTDKESLMIEENSIYYGMQTNDYVIANTKNLELNYPMGDENVYSSYQGDGGIQISSFLHRLLFAAEFRSAKILLSDDITNESRIKYKRNIMERVQNMAPFLTYDMDPYVVIADKKLYWIVDAYTHTNRYPYSQPQTFRDRNINYIRNSVKIVVDAFDGSVNFYVADSEDPLIRTVEKIFPHTFRPIEEMPVSQFEHIRYPEDILAIQAQKYKIYHMEEPQIFYNREDEWEIAAIGEEGGGSGGALSPRHLIMKLPNEEQEEFILMLPFTPRGKDNMSAWLAARNDGDRYGRLIAYTFPKDTLVFGPKQIMGRINQHEDISRQISLWDQRGSQVIRGSLLVIPIESSLIYVQPLYLQAQDGRIPELNRVIVAHKNSIEMANTLEEGLAVMFGVADRQPTEGIEQPLQEFDPQRRQLIIQARELYESALNAQRQGNWSEYGNRINELGEILNRLQN
jgi:uncharacterized protein